MGLFSFIKDAGAAVFGGAAPEADVTVPLSKQLAGIGVDASKLDFSFSGSTVVVSGTVPSQEDKEKAVVLLGNIQGVGAVDDRIQVASAAASEPAAPASAEPSAATPGGEPTPADWTSDTYTVQSGDTLWEIAKAVYGDGSKYQQIFEANTPMLADPDKIYPGQVLRIPPA